MDFKGRNNNIGNRRTSNRPSQARPTDSKAPVRTPTPTHAHAPESKTIEIKVSLPAVKSHPLISKAVRVVKRTTKKQRILILVCTVLLAGAITYVSYARAQADARIMVKNSTQNPLDKLERGTPKYPTVLPSGKSAEDLGGWTRVSPPDRDPVYAYVDKIGDIPISVSQQPLPADFADSPDEHVRSLALAHSAEKKLSAGSTNAFIGTASTGPQSVIFRKDKLLVLIKSSAIIPEQEWQKYIKSLG